MTAPTRTPTGAVRTGRLACIALFVAACAFVSPGAQQSPAIRVAGIATLRALPGMGEVAALPADLQNYTAYTAGALTAAKDPAATRAFLRYLTSPFARKVLVSHGLEPVAP